MKKAALVSVVVFAVLCSGVSHAALKNDRGTRAFSMEGAFVGQADDSSALWYNPAGLVQKNIPEVDLSVQTLSPDNATGANAYDMTSGSWSTHKEYAGIGINYVNYDYPTVKTGTGTTAVTTYGSDTAEYSLGFATNFGLSRFSLGATGGVIDYSSKQSGVKNEHSKQFVFGALLKVLDFDRFTLSLGVANRPQETYDILKDIANPESKEYGLNAKIITGYPIIGLNVQQDNVSYNYSDISSSQKYLDNGYKATAFGAELTFPFTENFTFAFRAGHRESSWDKHSIAPGALNTSTLYYGDVSSTSYGLGISIGQHFAFDVGRRKTSYSYSSPTAKTPDRQWTTASISLLF